MQQFVAALIPLLAQIGRITGLMGAAGGDRGARRRNACAPALVALADVVLMEERFEHRAACALELFERGPAGEEVTEEHGVGVLEPLQRLGEVVFQSVSRRLVGRWVEVEIGRCDVEIRQRIERQRISVLGDERERAGVERLV